jgi:hypothetical protein
MMWLADVDGREPAFNLDTIFMVYSARHIQWRSEGAYWNQRAASHRRRILIKPLGCYEHVLEAWEVPGRQCVRRQS